METRYQEKIKEEEAAAVRKRKMQADRAEALFVRNDKIIRKNDVIVDLAVNKIKLEAAEPEQNEKAVVKLEVVEDTSSAAIKVENEEYVTMETECGDLFPSSSSSPFSSVQNAGYILNESGDNSEHQRTIQNESGTTNHGEAIIEKISLLEAQLTSGVTTTTNLRMQVEELMTEKQQELATLAETCASLQLEVEGWRNRLDEKDKELSVEITTSASLRAQVAKMNELMCEKSAKIQRLTEVIFKWDQRPEVAGTLEDPATVSDVETTHKNDQMTANINNLLPLVLKLLLQLEVDNISDMNCNQNMGTLKSCRLVCKSWKQLVDQFLQEDPSHHTLTKGSIVLATSREKTTPSPLIFSLGKIRHTCRVIQQTLESFCNGERESTVSNYNPIPTRHLLIDIEFWAVLPLTWNKFHSDITEYLQVFGKQVWYLTISVNCGLRYERSIQQVTVVYKSLSNWFLLLPNVKSVSIDVLDGAVEELWFPRMDHLTTFLCSEPSSLIHSILKNNSQIQRLCFWNCYDSYDDTVLKVYTLEFPNLSELRCGLQSGQWLTDLGRVSWKPKRVNLDMVALPPPLIVRDVFHVLERWADTLQVLTIKVREVDASVFLNDQMDLPRLRELKIIHKTWEPQPWENVVRQMKNLNTFSLQLNNYDFARMSSHNPLSSEKSKSFMEYVNNFGTRMDWVSLAKLESVRLTVTLDSLHSYTSVGERTFFDVKRDGGPTIMFDLTRISKQVCDRVFGEWL